MVRSKLYHEVYRPQFHFTAKKDWLNDPVGLVYYKGEYHLSFEHTALPGQVGRGNMVWGHAVSPDMVRWKQLPNALEPDHLGVIASGSAVVDWENTAGFQSGREAAIVDIFTSAGNRPIIGKRPSSGTQFTQSLAYSNDRGRTWRKYEKNPVLGHIRGNNRDPKVIWHTPSKRWVMALFLEENDYVLLVSTNLRAWNHLCDLTLRGVSECPDLFELPVDGDPKNTRWVFWGGNGKHVVGFFDGCRFRRESEVLQSDWGTNFYAAQTWSDIPESDGRRLQIAWMSGGKYPGMPFSQQMGFPCELTLTTTPKGIRLSRRPIREIENIHQKEYSWSHRKLEPGGNLLSQIRGELFHIVTEVESGNAAEFGFTLRGERIRYDVPMSTLSCLGKSVSLGTLQSTIKLEILLDRTSLEIFGNEGGISLCFCFLPNPSNTDLEIYCCGGEIEIVSLRVYELHSIWSE